MKIRLEETGKEPVEYEAEQCLLLTLDFPIVMNEETGKTTAYPRTHLHVHGDMRELMKEVAQRLEEYRAHTRTD
jgi:hypothetical protein